MNSIDVDSGITRLAIHVGDFDIFAHDVLDPIEKARELGDFVFVIVRNSAQVQETLGRSQIVSESNRLRLVTALADVDDAIVSTTGNDTSQYDLLRKIAEGHAERELVFVCGSATRGDRTNFPEYDACQQLGIDIVYCYDMLP